MKKTAQRSVEVCADWVGLPEPTPMGILYATPARGKEIFSFAYNEEWLKSGHAQSLDPSLRLSSGHQYAPQGQENFGVFLDSSPDRWGRLLMDRREAQVARVQGRKERTLLESDYLLGVFDGHRMGALRFRANSKGVFLDSDKKLASPPWTSLRELEHASSELEQDDAEKSPNYADWLNMLIAPGSSLGGARPKASVVDEKEGLWIAKFPSRYDEDDIGAWEKLTHSLAVKAKVQSAQAELKKFTGRHHTFLTKRFDRTLTGERIHFASAMTLLQRSNGDDASKGVSYLDLVQFIIQFGAQPNKDLEQLWRRIVFFICVSNVDDHLRNHGFIFQPPGWVLAPAYDVNPVARGNGLKLNISTTDNSQDLVLAKNVAENFRVKAVRATEIVDEVVGAVKTWRSEATKLGIPAGEQDRMSRAFRVAER